MKAIRIHGYGGDLVLDEISVPDLAQATFSFAPASRVLIPLMSSSKAVRWMATFPLNSRTR